MSQPTATELTLLAPPDPTMTAAEARSLPPSPLLGRPWKPFLLVAGVTAILFLVGLGSYPLLDVDEPRYAAASLEMLHRGDWITPFFNGVVRFDKPPLTYWLVMLGYLTVGVNEWAARLPAALTAIGTAGMLCSFGRRLVGARFGVILALVFATSLEVLAIGRMCLTDMVLTACLTATQLLLFRAAHQDTKAWVPAGVFMGLSVLTKGPVGWVLPGLILAVDCVLNRRLKTTFLNRWMVIGMLVSLAISVPWFLAAGAANGAAFWDALFFHNLTRYREAVSGHDQPLWFYPAVFLLGLMPWTPMVLASLFNALPQGVLARRPVNVKGLPPSIPSLTRYATVWLLVTYLFFSLAQTQLLTYLLPLFPAAALLVATGWQTVESSLNPGALWRGAGRTWTILALLLCAAVLGLDVLRPTLAEKAPVFHALWTTSALPSALSVLGLGLAIGGWAFRRYRYTLAMASPMVSMLLVTPLVVYGVLPSVIQTVQGDLASFRSVVGHAPLVTLSVTRPSLMFYRQGVVPRLEPQDDAGWRALMAQHPQGVMMITKPRFVPDFQPTAERLGLTLTLLKAGDRYQLLHVEAPRGH